MKGRPWTLALCLGLGCADDVARVDDGDETESGTEATTGTESGSSDTSESAESESESETGEPDACGDGTLDPEEECDDGNDIDDDGCSNTCVSACGAEFAVQLTAPVEGEFFAVHAMVPGPDEAITLLGAMTTPGVGRLRVAAYMQMQPIAEAESVPLGPPGDMNAPQQHDATHVRPGPNGDVFALGSSVDPDADPAQSYWLARFSPELSELWRVPVGGSEPDFAPRGLAVLDGGDPVLVRTGYVADEDTDVLVRRLDGSDGSEVWASTHSGAFDGGWSLDEGWGVASGPGDLLWAMGLIRVDYQTHDTTLIELDAADGTVSGTEVPLEDPGGNHRQRPNDLAIGPQGQVAVAVNVYGPSSKHSHSRAYLYEDGALAWELDRDMLPWEDGDPFIDPKLAIDADGNTLVSGTYTHEFGFGSAARVWVVKLDPDGQISCYAQIGEGNNGGVVPADGFFGSGRAAIDLDTFGPGGMGPGSGENWLVGLRE